jgi:hypothetical protein
VTELTAALATGLLWLAAGGLVVLCIERGLGLERAPALLAGYPLFWATQVLLSQVLGFAGLLTTGVVLPLYIAGVLVLGLLAVRLPARTAVPQTVRSPDDAPIGRVARGVMALVFAALALFTLIAPVHIWDTLAYHMPMIASYVQNGSLDAWPTQDLRQIYRVNAGELQMLQLALLSRSDAWVELPNVAALAVLLVATYELARLATPRRAIAALAALLVLTAPQIVIGAGTEKNDLVFTAVLVGSFYWIIRAVIDPERRVLSITLAALCGALAGATKVMGLNVVGAVGLLSLALAVRRRWTLRHVVLFGGAALAGLLLLAGTVYLGNLTRSAVPVGVAPGEVNFTVGLRNVTAAAEFYVYDLMLKRLVTLPAIEHDFLHYGYLFPLMVVLGVAMTARQLHKRGRHASSPAQPQGERQPTASVSHVQRRRVTLYIATLTATLFVSVVAVRLPIQWDQRFMIWLVPAFAILALLLIERWPAHVLLRMTWIAAALVAVNVAVLLTLESDRLLPRSMRHIAATGELPRIADVPNRRYPDMIDGFAALDRMAAPSDSILYVGSDDSWMYASWGRRFTRHVEGVRDDGHAGRQAASRVFRFIVVEEAAGSAVKAAVEQAAGTGYSVVHAGRGRTLYERVPDPARARGNSRAPEDRTPAPVRGYTMGMSTPSLTQLTHSAGPTR